MLTYNFENRGKKPIYDCLYQYLKRDILEGKIQPQEKLPSKRALARHLEISVITVENAYAQLMLEGYIYAIEKRGYFVSTFAEAFSPEADKAEAVFNVADGNSPGHGVYVEQDSDLPDYHRGIKAAQTADRAYRLDLTSNLLAWELFPFSVWSRLLRHMIAEYREELLKPMPSQGVWLLRAAIAGHLRAFRAMEVSPEQILIGAGTEYLYSLLLQLLGQSAVYGVEEPGYQKIGQIYRKNHAKCVDIPLDEEGISTQFLIDKQVQVIHISPSHHFPTGRVMPIRQRQKLLNWAKEVQGYIIEDDYDSEFRFTGHPIPTMQSIDRGERVIYINTFSKTISPSIRISYMILPTHLLQQYREEMSFYSCTVSSFEQYTLAAFIEQGYLEKHINRMRNYYRDQRDCFIKALKSSRLAPYIQIMEEDAGLHFLVKITSGKSREQLRHEFDEKGIKISWLEDYYHGKEQLKEHIAVVNYSGIRQEEIEEAVQLLEEVYLSLHGDRGRTIGEESRR